MSFTRIRTSPLAPGCETVSFRRVSFMETGTGAEPAPRSIPDDGLFLDACGFALSASQVIQLGAPHGTMTLYLEVGDKRAVAGEYPLDGNAAAADLANGKGGILPAAPFLDYHASENLNPFLFALDDAVMNIDRVTGIKI